MLFYLLFVWTLSFNFLILNFVLISLTKFISSIILSLFVVYISWNICQFLWRFKWMPKSFIDPKGKAVLITGILIETYFE